MRRLRTPLLSLRGVSVDASLLPALCVRAMAERTLNPIRLRQSIPDTAIRIAVQGCEKRNIAATALRLSPSIPEKINKPISSLLPIWPGGVGRMKARLKSV